MSHAGQTYIGSMAKGGRSNTHRDTGIGDLIGSLVGFASASTIFALQQVRNALEIFVEPAGVMSRVRYSLDNISHAINQSVDDTNQQSSGTAGSQSQHLEEEVLAGRKR